MLKGAVFGKDYEKINKELGALLKNHETNVQKANKIFCDRVNELKKIASGAVSKGELKNFEVDNTTFFLEYSLDSAVDVAKVTDGAKKLGMHKGVSSNIVKIGANEIELEAKNGVRNYTGLISGDVIMTFQTSRGKLEVRLYADESITRVEVRDREKFNQLVNSGEEIGKNCLYGGLSVCDAIKRGYFERPCSKSSETIELPKT